jgi:hypothetical protein
MSDPSRQVCPACSERRANIERMIDRYRTAAKRRLLQRALRLFDDAEANHALAQFERTPDRIH